MTIEIGLTKESTNTQYAPLAVICAHYQRHQTLEPLQKVQIPMRERDFSSGDKLIQVLLSILVGCETLSQVNIRLKSETGLATMWDWPGWADQSTLSRTLDALTLMNLEELRQSISTIWQPDSQVKAHDWRAFLWLDFDLSGLPCGPQAQASQKGYFSDKKTLLVAS
jgi:hypothetical protein